jgi:hypothetical protein
VYKKEEMESKLKKKKANSSPKTLNPKPISKPISKP